LRFTFAHANYTKFRKTVRELLDAGTIEITGSARPRIRSVAPPQPLSFRSNNRADLHREMLQLPLRERRARWKEYFARLGDSRNAFKTKLPGEHSPDNPPPDHPETAPHLSVVK